jgi:CheY-like chemotaxis protein
VAGICIEEQNTLGIFMQQRAATQPAQDPTCLIVEDSDFDHRMMSRVIGRSAADMRVQIATTLQSAREALSRNAISLILLDNNLPDGNGANFALELANDPKLKLIPVIMVSDWPTPFMWDKAAKAGVLYVVNKSEFNVRFFKSALRNAIRIPRRVS